MDDNLDTRPGDEIHPGQASLKQQVLSSVAWVAGLTYLGQVFRWVVTIFVIRLLSPDDYGLMAKAMVFIGFLMMISELGLESALIQKKSLSDDQITHVFGMIIISNILLGLVFFFVSPAVAEFYSDPRLVSILRVLSSTFFFLPFYILQRGLLLRTMNFRTKSIVDLVGALLGAGMTLLLAILGYGVWALVLGGLATHVGWAIGYNVAAKKRILPRFAIRGYTQFITFGGYITGSRILWYFYSMSDIFIGGKFLTSKLLGYYSVALQLATIPIEKLMPIIAQVAFPAYSTIQGDIGQVRSHYLKSVRLISLLMFLLYGGLFVATPPMVGIFLGDKWAEIVLPLRLLSLIMPFRAVSNLFPPVLNGLGKPQVSFSNVTLAAVIMPTAFFIGVRWGILGVCLAWLIGYAPVFIIMSIRSLKVIDVPFRRFVSSFMLPLSSAALMIALVSAVDHYLGSHLHPVVQLIVYSLSGLCIYLIMILAFKRDLLFEVWRTARNRS